MDSILKLLKNVRSYPYNANALSYPLAQLASDLEYAMATGQKFETLKQDRQKKLSEAIIRGLKEEDILEGEIVLKTINEMDKYITDLIAHFPPSERDKLTNARLIRMVGLLVSAQDKEALEDINQGLEILSHHHFVKEKSFALEIFKRALIHKERVVKHLEAEKKPANNSEWLTEKVIINKLKQEVTRKNKEQAEENKKSEKAIREMSQYCNGYKIKLINLIYKIMKRDDSYFSTWSNFLKKSPKQFIHESLVSDDGNSILIAHPNNLLIKKAIQNYYIIDNLQHTYLKVRETRLNPTDRVHIFSFRFNEVIKDLQNINTIEDGYKKGFINRIQSTIRQWVRALKWRYTDVYQEVKKLATKLYDPRLFARKEKVAKPEHKPKAHQPHKMRNKK